MKNSRLLLTILVLTGILGLGSVPYWAYLGFIDPMVSLWTAPVATQSQATAETVTTENKAIQSPGISTTPQRSAAQASQTGSSGTITLQSKLLAIANDGLTASIQRLLFQTGDHSGPVDGKMGLRTRKAIRAFQQREGLPVDGKPSQTLLSTLRERSIQTGNTSCTMSCDLSGVKSRYRITF